MTPTLSAGAPFPTCACVYKLEYVPGPFLALIIAYRYKLSCKFSLAYHEP